MGSNNMGLCTERHFMGSSSAGRYTTDRAARPRHVELPNPGAFMHSVGQRTAAHARYLIEQNVPDLVLAHDDASKTVVSIQTLLARLQNPALLKRYTAEQIKSMSDLLDETLAIEMGRRREISRQLRLIGISPKEQAHILRAIMAHRDRADADDAENGCATLAEKA